MPTVLIVIDISTRELFGGLLLAHYLEASGLKTVLCNTLTFLEYYARHRPDAVVWPNPHWDLEWVAKGTLVFVLPTESRNGQHDSIAQYSGTPKIPVYTKPITRFFCWGQGMCDVLAGSGAWSAEQLIVTGSPHTDHWLLPRAESNSDRRVGLTTTFRAISNSTPPGKWNVFEWLDGVEQTGGEGEFFFPPDHVEAWMFVEASMARVMLGLCRELAVNRASLVEIRPHPWELAERYEYFARLPGGRTTVRKQGTISEWFERICILFTIMSASSLDAVVRGLPVVSFHPLLDPDALRKMPRNFRYAYEGCLWPLESFEQAVEYVDQAACGRLRPCRDEAAMARFLADYFAYPRDRPAAALVAEHIAEVLKEEEPRLKRSHRRRAIHGMRGLAEDIERVVPFAAPSAGLARYLRGRLPGQVDLDFTYWPWRRHERIAAHLAVDAVVARFPESPVQA